MKHYDKVFFLVALLALVAGIGIYFYGKPDKERTEKAVKEMIARKPKGVVWEEVKMPKPNFSTIEWPEIVAQDEDGKWFFQVFTPPQIWVDKDGQFITESPFIKEAARQSFALKFKGVSNEPYPIRYIGRLGDVNNPTISLYNEKTKMYFNGKLNQEIVTLQPSTGKKMNLGLTIKSIKTDRVDSKKATLSSMNVTIVLFDKKLGRDITIYSYKPTILEDQRRMTFILPDGTEWHVKEAGEEANAEKGKYIVKSVDFANESAVISLIPEDKNLEVQTMNVSKDGITPVETKKSKK